MGERKFLFKCCGAAIVLGLVVAFSIPKEYSTTVKLAPETSDPSKRWEIWVVWLLWLV